MFKNKNFVNLFIGRLLIIFGDAMLFLILLKYIELYAGDEFSKYYTILMVMTYLPVMILSYPIAVAIEGKYLQKVMLFSNITRVIVILPLFYFVQGGHKFLWVILFYLLIETILSLFYGPANQSLVVRLFTKEQLPQVNSMFFTSGIIAEGIALLATTLAISFGVNLTYLMGIVVILIVISSFQIFRVRPFIRNESIGKQSMKKTFTEGFSYIYNRKILLRVFGLVFFATIIANSIDYIVVNFANSVWKVGVESISYITVALMVGMVIGSILFPLLDKKIHSKNLLLLPVVIYPFVILSLNYIPNFYYTLPVFFVGGLSLGVFNLTFTTYMQRKIDREVFTRVAALYNTFNAVGPLPGVLILYLLNTFLSLQQLVVVISVFLLFLGIIAFFLLPRKEFEYEDERPE